VHVRWSTSSARTFALRSDCRRSASLFAWPLAWWRWLHLCSTASWALSSSCTCDSRTAERKPEYKHPGAQQPRRRLHGVCSGSRNERWMRHPNAIRRQSHEHGLTVHAESEYRLLHVAATWLTAKQAQVPVLASTG
jgi:hypothetical protein